MPRALGPDTLGGGAGDPEALGRTVEHAHQRRAPRAVAHHDEPPGLGTVAGRGEKREAQQTGDVDLGDRLVGVAPDRAAMADCLQSVHVSPS